MLLKTNNTAESNAVCFALRLAAGRFLTHVLGRLLASLCHSVHQAPSCLTYQVGLVLTGVGLVRGLQSTDDKDPYERRFGWSILGCPEALLCFHLYLLSCQL